MSPEVRQSRGEGVAAAGRGSGLDLAADDKDSLANTDESVSWWLSLGGRTVPVVGDREGQESAPYLRRIRTFAAPACLSTLVNASCTMR